MSGFDVSELLGDFLIEAGELVEGLGDQLVELEKAPDDPDLLNAVFRAFHTVKGGAGFMELNPLVDVCHHAEEVFDALRHGEITLDATIMDAAFEALDVVSDMMEGLRAGEPLQEPPTTLMTKLEGAAKGKAGKDTASTSNATQSSPAPSHVVESQLVDPAEEEFDALIKQVAATPVVENNNDAGASDDAAISDDEFEALLDQLHGTGKAPGNENDAAPASADSSIQQDNESSAQPESESRALAKTEKKPEPTRAKSRKPQTEATIRVDTQRLDTLINLAGELVLARNRLLRLRPDEGNDPALDKAVVTLDLITNDLQNAVMRMRMQPVKKLFSRFPKLIRELARSLDKKIELELTGEETELDKSLVDALSDPLVHLMRNAVDHGIEEPAERVAAGKAEEGNVHLSAAQEGEQIVITIEDDGRGMDPDVLRDKAVEKGLLTTEAASMLIPQECYELIFMPGFSTKAEVSEISGRGVGMDVVKSRIAELNGRIEIDSNLGAGSKIKVCVPLTLAILPTLMVCVRDRIFALPVANIGEVFELDQNSKRTLDGREVLMVRGRALPLVFLEQWISQSEPLPAGTEDEHVVVVQSGSQRVALVVDNVLGREEVVIKPLGSLLHGLPGLAGATITGDGRIALILDFASLFKDPQAQPRMVAA